MSQTFEPRRAEPGYAKRWAIQSLRLWARAPALYGVLIAVLVGLDQAITALSERGGSIAFLAAPLLVALVPVITLLSVMAARAADRGVSAMIREARLSRPLSFRLVPACLWGSFWVWAVFGVLAYLAVDQDGQTHRSMQSGLGMPLLISLFAHMFLLGLWGWFRMAIFAFHRLPWPAVRNLSDEGDRVQGFGYRFLSWGVVACTYSAYWVSHEFVFGWAVVPVLICLYGTFAYVSYREVFEGRKENGAMRSKQGAPALIAAPRETA